MESCLFETPRLQCRFWRQEDFADIYALYSDPVAMRWVGDGKPITAEDCQRWIGITLQNYERRGYGMFALVERQNGDMVGCCGLTHPGGQQEAEVKYTLRRSHWGLGLATEAVSALCQWAWRERRLHHIIATVDTANLVSLRVLEKCGFIQGEPRLEEDGSCICVLHWNANCE